MSLNFLDRLKKLSKTQRCLLAIAVVVVLIVVLNPRTFIRPGNPLPFASAIEQIEIDIETTDVDGGEPVRHRATVPADRIDEFVRLFDGSRGDLLPAKWKVLGRATIGMKSGEIWNVRLFHGPNAEVAAFKIGNIYYLGGRTSDIQRFCDSLSSPRRQQSRQPLE